MYILVRNDITDAQQAVQSGHALAGYCLQYQENARQWANSTLIYLEADLDTHPYMIKSKAFDSKHVQGLINLIKNVNE